MIVMIYIVFIILKKVSKKDPALSFSLNSWKPALLFGTQHQVSAFLRGGRWKAQKLSCARASDECRKTTTHKDTKGECQQVALIWKLEKWFKSHKGETNSGQFPEAKTFQAGVFSGLTSGMVG